jgi:hypothetical protein
MKRIYLLILAFVLLAGCKEEKVEPQKDPMFCLWKRKPLCTSPSCIGQPIWDFEKCITTVEAFQYANVTGWKIDECDKCE